MASRLERQKAFVARHGFTFKAYCVAFFLLPPAAILIAMKLPSLALGWRLALAVLVVVPPIVFTLGGAGLVMALLGR